MNRCAMEQLREVLNGRRASARILSLVICRRNMQRLLKDVPEYYLASRSIADEFGAASEYFHDKAIQWADRAFLSQRHIEYVYATLIAWGMHRMGDPAKVKTKLKPFANFFASLARHKHDLRRLRTSRLERLSDKTFGRIFDELQPIFLSLDVSESTAIVVAHSKTLHHVLPDLIPPVDRRYTLQFFRGNTNLPKAREKQYEVFRDICVRICEILKSDQLRRSRVIQDYQRDSPTGSLPKLVDNLIITFGKRQGAKLTAAHPVTR
jgi:hypothetical protein